MQILWSSIRYKGYRTQVNKLDSHPNLATFRLANNGFLIRMTPLVLTLGVGSQFEQYKCPVNWYLQNADLKSGDSL
ncbi:hypothetical protein TUM4636_29680 [Shewanella glacialipiscicola]|uniref:Uncharacterized protein n=1 Tax=Shewanella glacialipiscicola TaxID=614069 RepID=A0ABQ6J4B8_9GAMM|nr:hypothetical protein TUM4636_29680 [Shewanella glacialipiscicola]GMA82973.1 hypothetical protein GCM10025855_25060 [Shewanella glacialipiscicola]